MMVRLLTTFAVSALFYGSQSNSVIGDFSLVLYESLLGFIPMFVLVKCIKERKPRENRGGREKDSTKRKHSRSKNHRKRNSQNRNSRNNPENSKNSQGEKTSPTQKQKTGRTKDKSKSKETKSKLGSFISKIFGS